MMNSREKGFAIYLKNRRVHSDGNLDANRSSFHGSSASIVQFPTADKSGIVRVRSSFSDLSAEDRVLDLTTLDSYTKVP